MRPLDKGSTPSDALGDNIIVTEYKSWRKYLMDRIGYYCAYCNMPLSNSLQVEHVIPKNPPAGIPSGSTLNWDNMLLACGPCNNSKSNTPISASSFYLPEEHNTHLPFSIEELNSNSENAKVIPRVGLNSIQSQKAIKTIALLGLDDIDNRSAIVDLRSIKRRNAIYSAKSAKKVYDMAKDSPTFDANIVSNDIAIRALESGFFSLWYEEFKNEPLVMKKLTDNSIIKGTATNCFDPLNNYQPIPRNPHNLADPI